MTTPNTNAEALITANNDEVICPNCVTQFRAIPVNVQDLIRQQAQEIERLRDALQQALKALETCSQGDYSTGHVIDPSFDEELVNAARDAAEGALK